ncbi:MAG: T9SS type A sorting domain-containing protein, partial [Saprospiraceae bacterium]|nr:T9SS type A sorting domain-containing protein [Saprospiraceae bacterium]
LPTTREFEIVTTGIDAITGLQKVKFGNKSLKLNDPYDHSSGSCSGNYGVNKLVKRFKVTESNRDFTVWYALALENPSGHINSQPFFSIKCDLAPDRDLCFDAEIIDCDSTYSQPGCNSQLMDVLDWTCHRVKIPASEVGNIATIEITMGDCGLGVHNGYAYIDGICEECTGSALGSVTLYDNSPMVFGHGIDYSSCDGDRAEICGSYTEPLICGLWYLDSISVPGYTITNVRIDTVNKTFCFEFSRSNFMDFTAEIYAGGYFKRKGGGKLPVVFSNTIQIEEKLYHKKYEVNVHIGSCNDNGTSDNLSDDYYTVKVVFEGGSEGWTISKQLLDPYPNESGYQELYSGTGYYSDKLGPFLIQEGSWELTVTIGECVYKYTIEPPAYCSGCSAFQQMKIFDVMCDNSTTPNTWKFKINIPGTGSYYLDSTLRDRGTIYTIYAGYIDTACIKYNLIDINDPAVCNIYFTVCPPKPCTDSIDCDLDVAVRKILCIEGGFYVELEIDNLPTASICYDIIPVPTSPVSYTGGIFGPFSDDVTIIIYSCPGKSCQTCKNDKSCFKVIKVFKPDCSSGDFESYPAPKPSNTQEIKSTASKVSIVPNPGQNEVNIKSDMAETSLQIYDINGKIYGNIKFSDSEYKWNVEVLPVGIYVIKYIDEGGNIENIKFVKF